MKVQEIFSNPDSHSLGKDTIGVRQYTGTGRGNCGILVHSDDLAKRISEEFGWQRVGVSYGSSGERIMLRAPVKDAVEVIRSLESLDS